MFKKFVTIYALTVNLLTLLCFMIALGIGIYDIIQIINPAFSLSYEQHLINSQYPMMVYETSQSSSGTVEAAYEPDPASESELEDKYQSALVLVKHQAVQSLTLAGIVVFICLGVYIIHWRLAKHFGISQSQEAVHL